LSDTDGAYDTTAKPFYSTWSSFSTRKTFIWLNRFDEEDGEDRRMRRAIEKENKRARDLNVKEYNVAIRLLVAFIKKCDPRVEAHMASGMPSAEALEKQARDKVTEQQKKAREQNEQKLKEAMISEVKRPEWQNGGGRTEDDDFLSEDDAESNGEEGEVDKYECVACDKVFKSEKQYVAHEHSKKHKRALWELRKFMEKEDAELHLSKTRSHAKVDSDDLSSNTTATDANLSKNVDDDTATGIEKLALSSQEKSGSEDGVESEDNASETPVEEDFVHPDDLKPASTSTQPKLGKAAQKRARKAAAASGGTTTPTGDSTAAFRCTRCNAGFPSKTQLFTHIKELKHAAPLGAAAGKGKGRGKR
jgi:DnaJ homolog subfamily A member 5